MALTTAELVSLLQNEVRILLHLATKIDRSQLDYRPTPKQRSTIELLRYLSIMGPGLVPAIKTGNFDGAAWGAAVAAAAAKDLDGILADIAKQSDMYAAEVGSMSDAEMASPLELFGQSKSRGACWTVGWYPSCRTRRATIGSASRKSRTSASIPRLRRRLPSSRAAPS